jgi:hypothetical protein
MLFFFAKINQSMQILNLNKYYILFTHYFLLNIFLIINLLFKLLSHQKILKTEIERILNLGLLCNKYKSFFE